jgi:hypothetical protein
MELVVLAYNAVTELCDAQGDSQKKMKGLIAISRAHLTASE